MTMREIAEPPQQENYMPIEAELLPCPFCGQPAVLTNVRESNHTFIVGCYNELCVRPRTNGYGAKEDVIGLWNYRPAEPQPPTFCEEWAPDDRPQGRCCLPVGHAQAHRACVDGDPSGVVITTWDVAPAEPPTPEPAKKTLKDYELLEQRHEALSMNGYAEPRWLLGEWQRLAGDAIALLAVKEQP